MLGVVAPLASRLEDENIRHAIYALFNSAHAYKYIDSLVEWWVSEPDELAQGTLTQILSRLVKERDSTKLWNLWKQSRRKPFQFMLLAKLASFPSVEQEVKETLVNALNEGNYQVGDLEYISRVDDPRIQRWFEGQFESPHPAVRRWAHRVVDREMTYLPTCTAPSSSRTEIKSYSQLRLISMNSSASLRK